MPQKTANSARTSAATILIPLALLVVTGSLLGLSTNMAKMAHGAEIPPLAFLAWPILGAAIILTGVAGFRARLPALNARTVEYFLVSALVGVAGPNLIFFSAVPRVGVSFVALAIAFPPLLTYAGALFLGMERFQVWRALGVVLALAGAAVFAIFKISGNGADLFWVLATLFGPVLLAIGNIYRTVRWPEGARPDSLAPGMLVAAAMMLFLAGTASSQIPDLSLSLPTDYAIPVLLIAAQTAVFSMMYLLFFILQKRGGPVYLSLLGSVGAIGGIPFAIFLLGEAPPRGLAVGAALTAIGIGLVTFGGRQRQGASKKPPAGATVDAPVS